MRLTNRWNRFVYRAWSPAYDAHLGRFFRSGRAVVFDKFLADGAVPSLGRSLANVLTTTLGANIDRRLGDILEGAACKEARDEPSLPGGAYRVVELRVNRPA